MTEKLADYDIAFLIEQAIAKEAKGDLVDAADAYERAGDTKGAARVRALLAPTAAPAAKKEPAEEASDEPKTEPEYVPKGSKRSR